MPASGLGSYDGGENSTALHGLNACILSNLTPPHEAGPTLFPPSALKGGPLPGPRGPSRPQSPGPRDAFLSDRRSGFGPGRGGTHLAVVALHVVVPVHGHDTDGLIRALDREKARTRGRLGGSACCGGSGNDSEDHVGGLRRRAETRGGSQHGEETRQAASPSRTLAPTLRKPPVWLCSSAHRIRELVSSQSLT